MKKRKKLKSQNLFKSVLQKQNGNNHGEKLHKSIVDVKEKASENSKEGEESKLKPFPIKDTEKRFPKRKLF